jgi:hypothetical protein
MGHQYEAGDEADEGVAEARDGAIEAAEHRDEKPGGCASFVHDDPSWILSLTSRFFPI